jgi:nucleoside-diphosphate-sugar epimerase
MISMFYDFNGFNDFNMQPVQMTRLSALDWQPKILIEEGIRKTYRWCIENSVF